MRNFRGTLRFAVLLSAGLLAAAAPARAGSAYTPEIEPNGSAATATPLASGAAAQGNIYPNADVDVWSFSATAGDRIYAAAITSHSAHASFDSLLELLSTDGTTIIESDADDGSFGTSSSSIAGASVPTTGTYYLRIKYAVATNQIRPYRLYLQKRGGSPVAETEPNDIVPQALPGSGWVSGTIDDADVDLFDVALSAGDTLFLSLDLKPNRGGVDFAGRLGLGLFAGTYLVADDAGATTPDSEALAITVSATGTYTLLVEATDVDTGDYQLSATILPAATEGTSCTTYQSTDVPKTIPTGPGQVNSTITVPGNPRIADLDVTISLTHANMPDLDAHLVSPQGNDNGLFTDVGAAAYPVMGLTFDDEAALPVNAFTVMSGTIVAPELNYRLAWVDGEDAGGDWRLDLRDDLAGNGGELTDWSITICEPVAPPACPGGTIPVTVYTSDFESDAGGFTSSGTANEWERGLPSFAPITTCASGTSCWKTDLDNTYNLSSDQTLLSPAISLTDPDLVGPVVVSWAQRYQMEDASFDAFAVDVQEAGGANPTRLFDWLDATMTSTVGNPTTTIKESAGWGVQTRVLPAAYLGESIELTFRLTSDGVDNYAGVGIDDVTVTACETPPPPEADLSITKSDGVATYDPGTITTYSIVVSNAGPSAVVGATVSDPLPSGITTASWTCTASAGSSCAASGAGAIAESVDLLVGGTATFSFALTIPPGFRSDLVNTASVAPSGGITDPDPADNSATDTDTLDPNVFADGFESQDVCNWSSALGAPPC